MQTDIFCSACRLLIICISGKAVLSSACGWAQNPLNDFTDNKMEKIHSQPLCVHFDMWYITQ